MDDDDRIGQIQCYDLQLDAAIILANPHQAGIKRNDRLAAR